VISFQCVRRRRRVCKIALRGARNGHSVGGDFAHAVRERRSLCALATKSPRAISRQSGGQPANSGSEQGFMRLRTDLDTCRGGFQTGAGATNTDREVAHPSRNIDLDAFIVMSNHVHGIINLIDQSEWRYGIPRSCAASRRSPLAGSMNVSKAWRPVAAWLLRERHSHETPLDRIRGYIANNPAQWACDLDNITRATSAERGRV
jgi:hypothetical protein